MKNLFLHTADLEGVKHIGRLIGYLKNDCEDRMTSEQRAGAALIAYQNRVFGKIIDRYKEESLFMQFLSGVVWLFNRRFMKMISVVGKTIYWGEDQRRDVEDLKWWTFKVRAHEGCHLWDAKNNSIFWGLYLLPHLLGALLIFLGGWLPFVNIWLAAILSVLGAVLLSPLPNWCFASYYRAMAELRAYKVNMLINFWKHGSINTGTVDWVVKQFVTGAYYWMLPFKAYLRRRINRWINEVAAFDFMLFSFERNDIFHPYLLRLYRIMEQNNLVCGSVKHRAEKVIKSYDN